MKKKRTMALVKYYILTMVMFFALLAMGISGYYLYSVFTQFNNQKVTTNYNVMSDINYAVYMKDNKFINSEYLDMDQSYITKLVDKVSSNLTFHYDNTNDIETEYTYSIKGILNGVYRDETGKSQDAEVWRETVDIKNETNSLVSGENLDINEMVDIDIPNINKRVSAFQKEIGLPIVANYKLEMKVILTFDINGERSNKTHEAYINIPINDSVFSIERSVEGQHQVNVLKDMPKPKINNAYLVLSVLIIIVAILIIINITKPLYVKEKSKYDIELDSIFKLYGDRIVTVENIVRQPDSEFIDVVSFDEMIELVNELNLPILCWKKENKKETWFCAMKENLIYRYLILG